MLREETRQSGALLIFDEVYSFRLGYGGAQGDLGITPDITALGKIIGGGLPVGAVGGSAEVMAVFTSDGGTPRLVHGGTYNANPVTMSAGLAAMRMLTPANFEQLNKLGIRLREGMREVLSRLDVPGTVRGQGSLTSLRFSTSTADTYRDIVTDGADMHLADRIHRALLENGVLCTQTMLFILSTPMDEAIIDDTLDRFEMAVRTARERTS